MLKRPVGPTEQSAPRDLCTQVNQVKCHVTLIDGCDGEQRRVRRTAPYSASVSVMRASLCVSVCLSVCVCVCVKLQVVAYSDIARVLRLLAIASGSSPSLFPP